MPAILHCFCIAKVKLDTSVYLDDYAKEVCNVDMNIINSPQ